MWDETNDGLRELFENDDENDEGVITDSMRKMRDIADALTLPSQNKYYKEVCILFINVKRQLLPSTMEHTQQIDQSIKIFVTCLNNKDRTRLMHHRFTPNLIEEMIDLLEDLHNQYIDNTHIQSLVESILSFMTQYCVINKYTYKKNLLFLETYLCGDGTVKLLSAVILSLSMHTNKYLNILREYLDNESKNGGIFTENTIMVYKATLQSVDNNKDGGWTLSNIDYIIINNMHKYCTSLTMRGFSVDYIINIFNNVHKDGILRAMKEDSPLTECQKISINCLSVSLHYGSISESIIDIILSLLEELYPYTTKNIAATRITEIITYKLCECKEMTIRRHKNRIFDICCKNWHTAKVSEEIRLSSSVMMCRTYASINDMEFIVKYITDIINTMDVRGTDKYLGFSRVEIQHSISKVSS